MTARVLLTVGALSAALAVVAGALGAHALKDAAQMALMRTAVLYHMFHALGLLALGLLARQRPNAALLAWSGGFMFAGIVLFSGSLYLIALADLPGLRVVTPFGGTAFIVAWLLLAVAVWRA
jgi:uncharacterized membrane protein YgdD (TMEM256/DUF423 family)